MAFYEDHDLGAAPPRRTSGPGTGGRGEGGTPMLTHVLEWGLDRRRNQALLGAGLLALAALLVALALLLRAAGGPGLPLALLAVPALLLGLAVVASAALAPPDATATLDDAAWHMAGLTARPGEDEDDLIARAGAHIALFYRWSLTRDLGTGHDRETRRLLSAIARGDTPASPHMAGLTGWALAPQHLAPSLRPFARAYLGTRGLGADDAGRRHQGSATWTEAEVEFPRVAAVLDRRLADFQARGPAAVRRPGPLARMGGAHRPQPMRWRDE